MSRAVRCSLPRADRRAATIDGWISRAGARRRGAPRLGPAVVTLPVLGFLSLVGGQLPSFTTRANLYTICLGGALIWLGLSTGCPAGPRRPGWAAAPSGGCCRSRSSGSSRAATFLLGSTPEYPTLLPLADPLLEDELLRSAGYFGWLAGFWGLVRR